MAFFSRLTEIVACDLKTLLKEASNPNLAIRDIVGEIEEGVAGARRSCKTATDNIERLTREIDKQLGQVALWHAKAVEALRNQDETQARHALQRELEITDLTKALKQQQQAAQGTLEQIKTTLKGLEAQLATARREDQELNHPTGTLETQSAATETTGITASPDTSSTETIDVQRAAEIESFLNKMKQQLADDALTR
ncbi:MAG: PspA/IM30 family protein [Planctomycetaceae bacterium]|nr:PspA/IM30 family protein [Planctomycetaceae bacterium]